MHSLYINFYIDYVDVHKLSTLGPSCTHTSESTGLWNTKEMVFQGFFTSA